MLRPIRVSPAVEAFSARTPTLLPATHTNSYALGMREVLLVEPATPYEDEQRAWIEWARGLPSQGRTPVAILATHHHPDHVGGLDVLSHELSLPVWAHAETRTRVGESLVVRELSDGETITLAGPEPTQWNVLHTPGHAPGHLCLHEAASGALVVGDMVASVGTILIARGDGHMQTYLAQLERLAQLNAVTALPAHGDPIATPTALFQYYIAHRLKREQKVLKALHEMGPAFSTLHQLVAKAYDDAPESLWPIAELSLDAHLEKLEEEGKAIQREGAFSAADPAR